MTFTFSEAPTGFTAGDITAVGGTVSGLSATSDPLVYTATFTAADGFAGTGSVSVGAGSYTDAALNAGGAGSDTVTIDRDARRVTVDIVDGLAERRRRQLGGHLHLQRGAGRVCARRHRGGGRHAQRSDRDVRSASLHGDVHRGRRLRRHRLGRGGGGQLHRPALNAGGSGSDTVAIDRGRPTVMVDIVDRR